MQEFKKVLVRLLRDTANKLENNTCEITEEEALSIVNNMTHIAISKEMACNHLNISRSKFDALIKQGKIPEGRKRVGFKELVFYKDELDEAIKRIR